jgi:NhaA family Na+:H+ antiporter
VLVGIALWLSVLESGVHATLSGVITALFVPLRDPAGASPLHKIADDLKKPVYFGIVPLFAFTNAGVSFTGVGFGELSSTVTLGVISGLVLGKPIGIIAAVGLVLASGLGRLPPGVGRRHMLGAGCLAGIGFTMSLFIGTLAFGASPVMNEVKLGVLCGSFLSASLGVAILWNAGRHARRIRRSA